MNKQGYWKRVYGLSIVIILAVAGWSVMGLHFQTDIFSLFPQELDSLKELRRVQKEQTVAKSAFLVLDSETAWEKEKQEIFWEAVVTSLREQGIENLRLGGSATTEESYQAEQKEKMALWLATKVAAWPEERFLALADQLKPKKIEEHLRQVPFRLAGAFDEEVLVRLQLDPLEIMGDEFWRLQEKKRAALILDEEKRKLPLFLQVIPSKNAQSFEASQDLEIALETSVQHALKKVKSPESRPFVYLTGDPIFTAQISRHMKRDILVMVSFTLTLVLLIFWAVYRSLKPVLWIALAQIMAVACAFIAARIFIGKLNVISMGFASILMGVSIDYSILVYHHFATGEKLKSNRWKLLKRGIWFSALTTAVAFGVLYFSSFPGLQQFSILVAVGLLGSAGFATTFLAWLLSQSVLPRPPHLENIAEWWGEKVGQLKRWIFLGTGVAGILFVVFLVSNATKGERIYDADISKLQPSQLRAYRGHAILKSYATQQMSEISDEEIGDWEKNRKFWVAGNEEQIRQIAEEVGLEADFLEPSLQIIRLLDKWKKEKISTDQLQRLTTPGAIEWEILRADLDRKAVEDFIKLTALALGVMLLFSWMAHRAVRLVLLNFSSLFIAFFLFLTVLLGLGMKLTIVSLLCLPLLIGVVLDYTMHMLIGLEHEQGDLIRSFRHLLVPISLTGITSIIGCTAPVLSSQPALVNFGLIMDIGILCAIITALILLPLLYRFISDFNNQRKKEGSHYSRFLYRAQMFELGAFCLSRLPRSWVRACAKKGGVFYAYLNPKKTDVVRKNLSLLSSDPVPSEDVHQVYGNFAAALADYFYLGTRKKEVAVGLLKERIGYEYLREAHEMGRGTLLLTSHLSLFELGGVLMTELGFPSVALTIPEPNSELTEWRTSFRKRWGVETKEVGSDAFSSLSILNFFRENKAVIALIDRPMSSQVTKVQFPNGTANFAGGILLLAQVVKCPIVVATIVQRPDGYYRAEVHKPFLIEPCETREQTLEKYSQKIAEMLIPTLQKNQTHWFQFVALDEDVPTISF